ncbi:TNF receptor-associated factor 2 [Apodemus speciosus]|uniref:TNF receptor-associated factor n=1 Tax=Apodemus speciosus TaxID=105296 RepID=A0ABQ0EG71_APOSI
MAAASVTSPGSLELLQPGFSKTLLGTRLEAKYLCSACRNILRRPFQAQCGHRYCSSFCLTSILSSGPQNCAACVHEGLYEEGVSILESSSAFPDNAARREVESLPAVCPNDGCTWKGTLKEYEVHYEVCPKFPLTCDGCGKKKISREKFQDHVKACNKCRVPCRFHSIGCSEMVEPENLQDHELRRLREHLALLLSSFLECQASQGAPAQAGPELLQRCQSLEQKIATFENIVCVLNREVERVAVTAEACSRQHRLDQDKIEALSNKVQQLERSIGLKDLAMADLEQKVSELEVSTYDGVFIWKISDFARKRQEAVAGRTPAIFSPDVTLMLLDHNNREHVIDAFRPDVTSSSFQRPVSDMNIASGCPLFCPVSKMEAKNSYVRDDAIFIKAIVDLTGL